MTFKFFRAYNKWLLAFGMVALMIVFLVEGAIPHIQSRFQHNPTIGTFKGGTLTGKDHELAAKEMAILERKGLPVGVREAEQWFLLLQEAKQMGLSASDYEIEQLKQMLPATPNERDITDAEIREALRDWLTVQTHRELTLGLGHVSMAEKQQYMVLANRFAQVGLMEQASTFANRSAGSPRFSEPLLLRFMQDQGASVKITAVRVPASRYLPQVADLDAKDINELFEIYKDRVAGQGDSYAFGYRSPERVKIEYLAFPIDRLIDVVNLDEAEIFSYYDSHRDQFRPIPPSTTQPAPPAPENPTREDRRTIISTLRNQKADELAARMIKSATAIMNAEASKFKESREGYREPPADWKPIALSRVAEQLQKEFGVLPTVVRLDDRWVDQREFGKLDGIGALGLMLDARRGVPAAQYVFSVKEVSPKADNALLSRRLQVGLPSQALVSMDRTRYIFRVIAAEPARTPTSIDEVKDQVARDARLVKALELLIKDRDTWQQRFLKQGPESLAKEIGTGLLTPPPFPRRIGGQNGSLEVPDIDGIGKSKSVVDSAFELAVRVNDAGGPAKAAPAERVDAIADNATLSLYVVRLDDFKPITREEYQREAALPTAGVWLYQTMIAEAPTDATSLNQAAKRLGWKPENEKPAEGSTTGGQ